MKSLISGLNLSILTDDEIQSFTNKDTLTVNDILNLHSLIEFRAEKIVLLCNKTHLHTILELLFEDYIHWECSYNYKY